MSNRRSRVAFAIAGTIVFAATGAVMAARSALPSDQASAAAITTSQSPTATDPSVLIDATATAIPTLATTPGATSQPTSQPTPRPTAHPTVTPGGVQTLNGRILSVNASAGTFSYHIFGGANNTIVTNGQTQFTGVATQFSGLQPNMRASVTGKYQTDGTFLATRVNTSIND